jgi:hypothetical protein
MEDFENLGLKNYFEGKPGSGAHGDIYKGTQPFLNVRNKGDDRTTLFELELRTPNHNILAEFRPKEEDQILLALSMLGVGRVTAKVEEEADTLYNTYNEEQLLERAVASLRAIQIARELKAKESEKTMDEAYALYRLAYPDAAVTRSEFPDQSMSNFWVATLQKIRKDPTVLGSL